MPRKNGQKLNLRKQVKANPNQRYYTIPNEDGQPTTYDEVKGKDKTKKHYSVSANLSKLSEAYPRSPSFSPISRLKFGQQLEEKIQKVIKEKFASGASTTVISVGNISSLDTVKTLNEDEILKKFGTNNITSNFERPYDDIDYTTFHDAVRSDGMTRIVSTKRPQYIIGEYTDIEFTPTFFIEDEDERNETQDSLNKNELLNSLKQELKDIDVAVDFYLAVNGLLMHESTFGQGLVAIEEDDDHLPIALKILSGMRIGRLFKGRDKWDIKGVEYLDYSAANNKNILLAENILYVPNLDYNLAPNTSGYGLSDLETIRHIAEQNVILNQMDLKEGNAKYHTPKTFTSVKNAETPDDITDLSNAMEVSQSVVTDLDAEAKVIDNTMDVLALAEERDKNDQAIARYFDVPEVLAGFENAQIRAAASQVLFAWTQSSLLKARDILRLYLQKQWYLRNLKFLIKRRLRRLGILVTQTGEDGKKTEVVSREALNAQTPQKQEGEQEEQGEQEDGKPKVDVTQKLSEDGLPIDENGGEVIPKIESFTSIRDFIPFLEQLEKLPFTIKMTFEPITIDGLLEKAATVIGLKNARIINNMYAWRLLKFKDLIANPPDELMNDQLVLNAQLLAAQGQNPNLKPPASKANNPNFRNPNQPKGGLGDIASTNIEKFVTSRGSKPKPKVSINK